MSFSGISILYPHPRFPHDSIRYNTHAYSFKTKKSEPFFKSPALPKLANLDSKDQSDKTDLFYIDLYIRFGCSIFSLTDNWNKSLSWFEIYREMYSRFSKIRPDSGI
jgi:hypothetical protein